MSLPHGGHLTHGSPVNLSGKWFNVVAYGLDPQSELIDYAETERLAREHKPKLIIAGASAYSRVIEWKRFRAIADEVGACSWSTWRTTPGSIAAGVYPSPVGIADYVTSTTHKTMRGPRGGFILMKEEHAKAINSAVFPGLQGGPLMHVIAAKAVAFGEALDARLQGLPGARARKCPRAGEGHAGAGPARRLRRHRLAHVPRGPARQAA